MPKNLEKTGKGPEEVMVLKEPGAKTLTPGDALKKAFLKASLMKRNGEINRQKDIMKPSSDNAMKMREKEIK